MQTNIKHRHFKFYKTLDIDNDSKFCVMFKVKKKNR